MWRTLSSEEKKQALSLRQPLTKVVKTVYLVLLGILGAFAFLNLLDSFSNLLNLIGFAIFAGLIAALTFAYRWLVNSFSEDINRDELLVCEAEIIGFTSEDRTVTVIGANKSQDTITYYVQVKALESGQVFKINSGLEYTKRHKVGDRVLVFGPKNALTEERMMVGD